MSAADSATDSEQLIRAAQQHARDIVAGIVSPYDGGRRIWRECQLRLGADDHRLDPFVYWASEYEETVDEARRNLCNEAIRKAAELLVRNGSAL
jgi:hypothetical protein